MGELNIIKQYIEVEHPELKSKGRLYVLCSDKFKDNPVYACVQGGHAVAGYMKESFEDYMDELLYDENAERHFWQNETIVYLWYPHDKLNLYTKGRGWPYVLNNVSNKGVWHFDWREPDQDYEITAMTFWEDDLMNIDCHDPYFWGHTKEDAVRELSHTRKEIDKLELVRIPNLYKKETLLEKLLNRINKYLKV